MICDFKNIIMEKEELLINPSFVNSIQGTILGNVEEYEQTHIYDSKLSA